MTGIQNSYQTFVFLFSIYGNKKIVLNTQLVKTAGFIDAYFTGMNNN